MVPFLVKVPGFEGPLGLLLEMAKKGEVDLKALSISAILKELIRSFKKAEKKYLGFWADQLLIVAVLAFLKSKVLLPTREEDLEIEPFVPQRDQVLDLLVDFLSGRPLLDWDVFTRPKIEGEEEELELELSALMVSARVLLKRPSGPKGEFRPHDAFDLKRAMALLLDRLEREGEFRLQGPKEEVIPLFLAALELCRQGHISLHQEAPFGEIWVRSRWRPVAEVSS